MNGPSIVTAIVWVGYKLFVRYDFAISIEFSVLRNGMPLQTVVAAGRAHFPNFNSTVEPVRRDTGAEIPAKACAHECSELSGGD